MMCCCHRCERRIALPYIGFLVVSQSYLQLLLYPCHLFLVPLPQGLLLLVQQFLQDFGDPGLVIGKTAYNSDRNNGISAKINIVCDAVYHALCLPQLAHISPPVCCLKTDHFMVFFVTDCLWTKKKGIWVSVKPGGIQTFQAEAEQIDELFASFTFAYRRSSVLFSLVAQLTN